MTTKVPSKEEFLKDIENKFPMMEKVREHELKKTAHKIFNQSTIGKISSVIYLIIAIASIFLYWKTFKLNVLFSILLGIVTWFVVTYIFDRILIKLSGIEKILTQVNKEETQASLEELKKAGVLK
jgi:hypothetical protein